MITEDYVSFETAKLLKEKGYWNMATMLYKENGDIVNYNVPLNNKGFSSTLGVFYEAPTLQMAMKWLLDTYKLHIVPTPYPHEDGEFYWAYKIAFLDSETLAVMVVKQKSGFDSKENACEAAINYCLENLI